MTQPESCDSICRSSALRCESFNPGLIIENLDGNPPFVLAVDKRFHEGRKSRSHARATSIRVIGVKMDCMVDGFLDNGFNRLRFTRHGLAIQVKPNLSESIRETRSSPASAVNKKSPSSGPRLDRQSLHTPQIDRKPRESPLGKLHGLLVMDSRQ